MYVSRDSWTTFRRSSVFLRIVTFPNNMEHRAVSVRQLSSCFALGIFTVTNTRRLAHLVVHVRSIKEIGCRLRRLPFSLFMRNER